jgi:hypothetical protein
MSSSPHYAWFDMNTLLFNARPPHEPERDCAESQSQHLPSCGGWSATQPRSESRERRTYFREVLDCGGKRSATPLSHGGSRAVFVRHTTSESGAKATALQTLSRPTSGFEPREASGLRRVHRRFLNAPQTIVSQTL